MIPCGVNGGDKVFLRAPLRTASAFLVEFAKVIEVIHVISDRVLGPSFRWSWKKIVGLLRIWLGLPDFQNVRGIHIAVMPKSESLGVSSAIVFQCFPPPSRYHSNIWSWMSSLTMATHIIECSVKYHGVIVILVWVCCICDWCHSWAIMGEAGLKTIATRPLSTWRFRQSKSGAEWRHLIGSEAVWGSRWHLSDKQVSRDAKSCPDNSHTDRGTGFYQVVGGCLKTDLKPSCPIPPHWHFLLQKGFPTDSTFNHYPPPSLSPFDILRLCL